MVVLHVGVVVVIVDVITAIFADAVCSCYCRQRVVNRSSGVVAVAPAVAVVVSSSSSSSSLLLLLVVLVVTDEN